MITEVLGLGLLVLILWLYASKNGSANKRPPGPLQIPVIGNIIQLALNDKRPERAFANFAKVYGPICELKIGATTAILVSGFDAISEMMVMEECQGRNVDTLLVERNFGRNLGIIFSEGNAHVDLRNYTTKILKKYGFGKQKTMEQRVLDESQELVESIEKSVEKDPQNIIHVDIMFFMMYTLNILFCMVTGKTYSKDKDSEMFKMLRASKKMASGGEAGGGLYNAFPILKTVCPNLVGVGQMLEGISEMHAIGKKLFEEFRENGEYRKKTEPECFMDAYLKSMDEERNKYSFEITEEQFIVMFIDFVQAGSETTSNTLGSGVLFMTAYPNVQEKLFREIKDVVGTQRLPALEDRERMPYTQAFILEAYRHAATVTLLVRSAVRDCVIGGYNVSKNNTIIGNLHTVFMDSGYWEDPKEFRPERFLTIDMKSIDKAKSERMIIFGKGKKMCLGDNLARDTLFIFWTSLVQKFKFSFPNDCPQPSLETSIGWTNCYKAFDTVVTKR